MKRIEIAFASAILALGLSMLVLTMRMPSFTLALLVDEAPGPAFLPFLIAVGLVGIGLARVLQSLRLPSRNDDPSAAFVPDWEALLRVGVTLAALALALALLKVLGFAVTAMLLITGVTWLLGTTKIKLLILVPVAAAAVLHLVFSVMLKVPLPAGLLDLLPG